MEPEEGRRGGWPTFLQTVFCTHCFAWNVTTYKTDGIGEGSKTISRGARVKHEGFWVFDTEDNSAGSVYWINFYNGVEHIAFDNFVDALGWILQQDGEFWAVNLEYDMINLFGPFLDKLCVLTYGGFGLLKASIYGKPVQFRNTLRHWPLSVEEMGVRLGYPKLPFDPTNLQYCQRDCEVTYRFIHEMCARYEELGIEEIKSTLPGTSLAFFRDKFCKVNYQRHPDLDVWKFLSVSRYGGRCEVFWNQPIEDTVHEYDINSSYPYVMVNERFPNLDTMTLYPKSHDFTREGVAHCRVFVPPMEFPLLPWKDPESGKLLFPCGRFAGTWTYVELRKAIELGVKVEEVYSCVEYDAMESPFSEYMTFLYNKRMEVKDSDELMSYTLKICMNSLFGKWGEEGEMQVISRGVRHTLSQVPKHSNQIWSSYILAYGRLNLYNFMMQGIQRGTLCYVDTDSLFLRCAREPFGKGTKELGGLAKKGSYNFAHFKLPKLYRVDDKYKAKGVPRSRTNKEDPEELKRTFFYDGVAEFLKPYRWMESKKLKEQANVWHMVSKQLSAEYDKRNTFPDGHTTPLTIGPGGVINTSQRN